MCLFKTKCSLPGRIIHEVNPWALIRIISSRASEEEIPLFHWNLAISSQNIRGVQEWIQQLILLKESSAYILIEGIRDISDNYIQSGLAIFTLLGLLKSSFEQFHKEL